jgi:hypothetical protein
MIEKHYCYVIEKGFKILVNDKEVKPSSIQTLLDSEAFSRGGGIQPYVYVADTNGVSIQLVMGLYEKLPTDQEREESEEGRRNKENAGWTIVCNDRVVVAADKTRMTGWGEAGVPAYHSQFTALAGVVIFKSNNALLLPVTTTKRGIDQDSDIYGDVKEVMRDALKTFTSFTNKWKAQSPERDAIQRNAAPMDVRKIEAIVPKESWHKVRNSIGGKRFIPKLPEPPKEERNKKIQYTRPLEQIEIVSRYLLDEPHKKPADVGAAAFDWVYERAK